MKIKIILTVFTLCFFLGGCSNDDEYRDMEKPSIDMSIDDAYPTNCAVLYRGETFSFRAIFTDNNELGDYNIEIHNNFDHHSHSTDDVECDLEPKKKPVNPFIYNQDFSIPNGKTTFKTDDAIFIPKDVDTGDYHFMIRLTDKAGWQQLKAVSIKIKDE